MPSFVVTYRRADGQEFSNSCRGQCLTPTTDDSKDIGYPQCLAYHAKELRLDNPLPIEESDTDYAPSSTPTTASPVLPLTKKRKFLPSLGPSRLSFGSSPDGPVARPSAPPEEPVRSLGSTLSPHLPVPNMCGHAKCFAIRAYERAIAAGLTCADEDFVIYR